MVTYCQAQQASTQLKLSFDLKSKIVILNSKTLEVSSDLNPISHGPFNPILAP